MRTAADFHSAVQVARSTTWKNIPVPVQEPIRRALGRASLNENDIPFLYGLISALTPTRAIEVGLARGSSAAVMAAAAQSTLHIYDVIDPYQSSGFGNHGLDIVQEMLAGTPCKLQFFEEMSHAVLPRLLAGESHYDYALIDASHKFDATLIEVFYIDQMLVPGGVMVLDDRVWPMVGAVVAFMKENYRHLWVDATHPRLTLVYKSGEDQRAWYDWWPFSVPRNATMEKRIEALREQHGSPWQPQDRETPPDAAQQGMDDTAPDGIDPAWYARRYPDVPLSGLDPVIHYHRYGRLLGRRPNPRFDPVFYARTYTDVAGGAADALAHHLSDPRFSTRPTCQEAITEELARVGQDTAQQWGTLDPQIAVSYCIPIMNRGDDLRATLPANLAAHRDLSGRVEFIILFFDEDHATHDWVRTQFADDLASGLLRVLTSDALASWHFGRAKNAFRPHLRGRVYSSLDGDNSVTREETDQLLGIEAEYGEHFILHHFSGTWGDGSSGRISLPAALYRAVGYNDRFLPRQYDEIDLILSVIRRFPAIPFLYLSQTESALSKSIATRNFIAAAGIANPWRAVPPTRRIAPLNPKDARYVADDAAMQAMTDFNRAFSFASNAGDEVNPSPFIEAAVRARRELVAAMPAQQLLETVFEPPFPARLPPPGRHEVSLFACVRNEEDFLAPFLAHYRARGVTRFFLVDDHSDRPVSALVSAPDTVVVRPAIGNFRLAKTLWLETLMKAFLAEGDWALTVDADEFIDLPPGHADFRALARTATEQGAEWIAGLLIDLLPGPDLAERLRDPSAAFEDLFIHHCLVPDPPTQAYADYHAIRWGFGAHAWLSWAFDARFHAFGTFDSLRKLPFLRHRAGRHLNQGFHDLHYLDGRPAPGHGVWESELILPVRHYKLAKLLSATASARLVDSADGYHARTAGNIRHAFGDQQRALERLASLPARRYAPGCILDARSRQPETA